MICSAGELESCVDVVSALSVVASLVSALSFFPEPRPRCLLFRLLFGLAGFVVCVCVGVAIVTSNLAVEYRFITGRDKFQSAYIPRLDCLGAVGK